MRIGIWLRVSTEEQALTEVLQNHEQRAREYCNLYNYEIVETYTLAGVSGKNVLLHPEAHRMLKDVADGKIQGLVFSKLARLARNTRDLLEIADHFRQHRCALMSVEEKIFDTSSHAGELIFTIVAALSQWERSEIASRVAAMVPIRAKQQKHIGGIGPFGYSWIDGKLTPDHDKSLIVKKAFEIFISTTKIKTTASILNKMGYRAAKSNWGSTTLKRLLTDPVYKGEYRQNYSKSKGEGKSWVIKSEEEWVINQVTPIVSEEIWNQVQDMFASRPTTYQTGIPKVSKYLYGGLLTCSCGKKMYVIPYKAMVVPRYVCGACGSRIWESDITTAFRNSLKRAVVSPEQLAHDNDEQQGRETKEAELSGLKRQYEKQIVRRERLMDLYLDEGISKAELAKRQESLKEIMTQQASSIERLSKELEASQRAAEGRTHIANQARTLASMWDELEYFEQKEMAHELVRRISLDGDTLRIQFFWLPEDNLPGTEQGNVETVPHPQGCVNLSLLYPFETALVLN